MIGRMSRWFGIHTLFGLRLVILIVAVALRISASNLKNVATQGPPLPPDVAALPPDFQNVDHSLPRVPDNSPPGWDQNFNPTDQLPQYVMDNFTRSVDLITAEVAKRYGFCIQDVEADKRSTFDVSSNSSVLRECFLLLGDTFVDRMCGEAEISFYVSQISRMKDPGPPPTVNCNSFSWSAACDPGWSGLSVSNGTSQSDVANGIPVRFSSPQPCCPGFFCPRGLTCMMPCPLGAYCPLANFVESTGSCEPYKYEVHSGSNSPCGGADLWLTYEQSKGMFCEAGHYCPGTTEMDRCEAGHYCRAGSTHENKCSFLSKCTTGGQKSQNLTSTGILLIVVLFVILLLIYNCSEQLMDISQRRKWKARETAARQAREHLTAVERWRKAVEAAKNASKQAVKFSGELTRSLSRKKSKSVTDDPLPTGHRSGPLPGPSNVQRSGRPLGARSGPLPTGLGVTAAIEEDKEMIEQESRLLGDDSAHQGSSIAWTADLYSFEQQPVSCDLYDPVPVPPVCTQNSEAESDAPRSMKKSERSADPGPPKLPHTRSQIYKYAYGQIEKEKATHQMKEFNLEEVVVSDGFQELLVGKGRFRIELSFVGLSLTLKGSGRKILSNVTGKFSPCRVSAVMGPSGAGKTTFLNALAGKETGSRITGQVFINGHPGSIQSYKRIIGFVPQDDVVHGTLTVEENLQFSAKYRLPASIPKRERVLVVERIINTLGLMPIRDSLVGTVEKRGISGGQRKRVNVAMELVIEPSLLILDEPTSGLDSTSSRLVLQALRREAAWGVNVCVVLHQPSYGLFRMFDDVMLLAKGGYTVYLGPVEDVEEYFQHLGFRVPDRINPPDYFMDVLEGIVSPENDPNFDPKSLPVRWMSHKNYAIPPELRDGTGEVDGGTPNRWDDSVRTSSDHTKSFTRDVWDEMRVYVVLTWDAIESSFSSVRDLSGRQTPGFFSQYRLILARVSKQNFRETRLYAQDYIILLLAGIAMGATADWTDSNLGAKGYTYTIIALSLLVMIASLRTFTTDKLNFWRESASGINRLSFFLAKDTVDLFNTLIKPVVYLSMFYFFNDPRSTFVSNYIITLALVYCVTGIAYILAIIMNPQPAQLFSVFIPVLATLMVTTSGEGIRATIAKLSFAQYALEAYVIANAERYTGVWLITRCGAMIDKGYNIGHRLRDVGILLGYGVGARTLALVCLILCHRKRQK